MAKKDRVVRRVDEKNPNLITGGGQLIQGNQVPIPTGAIIQPPEPQNVTIGSQVLLRNTYSPKVGVNVSWSAPNNLLPELYVIEYARNQEFTQNVLRQSTTLTNIALEMEPGKTYWVRVQACIQGLYSDWAYPNEDPVTAALTTINNTTPPDPVTDLSGSWSNGDLTITWNNPASDNFFQTRVRIYDTVGGTLYKEVFVVGNPSSKSQYVFRVSDNAAVTAGAFLKSMYVQLHAYSLFGVPATTAVTATFTKTPPATPTGLVSSWDNDDGNFEAHVGLYWNSVADVKDYVVEIDGIVNKYTNSNAYQYSYSENVADHRPTLTSGESSISYTVYARDHLNQLSTGASDVATNLAPSADNFTLHTAGGLDSLYAYVDIDQPTKDIYGYNWDLLVSGEVVDSQLTTTPMVTFPSLNGIYSLQFTAVDVFGQSSEPLLASGIIVDGLTIEQLRAGAMYSSSDGQSQENLDKLKDGNLTVTATSHTSGATWQDITVERVYEDRYKVVTLATGTVSAGTVQVYFSVSEDGTTWSWFSGPLTSTGTIAGNTTLTSCADEVTAQLNAISLTASTAYRFDFPQLQNVRFIRLHHRNTTGNYNFCEFYPRRLVQSDDIEAESIKAINIAANAVTATHINVAELSAIAANIGQLVINSGGHIWQGTGTASSPTTGLLIDQSGGVGRLRTFNSGTLQISLDTDGKLKAGAGNVLIDAAGITVRSGTSRPISESSLIKIGTPDAIGTIGGVVGSTALTNTFYIESPASAFNSVIMLQATDKNNVDTYIKIGPSGNLLGWTNEVKISTTDLNITATRTKVSGWVSTGSPSGSPGTYDIWAQGVIRSDNSMRADVFHANSVTKTVFNAAVDEWLRINPSSHFANGVYTPGALRVDGGINSNVPGTPSPIAAGNVGYAGTLQSYKNGTLYTVHGLTPLTTPLTAAAWTSSTRSTTGKTLIDLSAVFGAPAGIKAVLMRVAVSDSGAAGTDCHIILGPLSSAGTGIGISCLPVNNRPQRAEVIVPCNGNGDIYYQIVASGSNTMTVTLEIYGYLI